VTANEATAIFSAAPHGVSAALIDRLLAAGEQAGTQPGSSTSPRTSATPPRTRTRPSTGTRTAHPRASPSSRAPCPSTWPTLATSARRAPGLLRDGRAARSVAVAGNGTRRATLFVSGVTGSTGSGRQPTPGTHHPQRHSDLYSYNALAHRHTPEITALARAASGIEADFAFVPHSGPFARGIHVTVQAEAREPVTTRDVVNALHEYYDGSTFVRVGSEMPRLKDVVSSNFAELSGVSNGRTVAVMCVLDNLTKGAAGGAVQWMNRMFGYAETAGLLTPAPGWT
jgi:N-acetyl-gamma-glutamyl-phosphate reductase